MSSSSFASPTSARPRTANSSWESYRDSLAYRENQKAQERYIPHRRLKTDQGRASPSPPPSYAAPSDRLARCAGQQQPLIDRVSNSWMEDKIGSNGALNDYDSGCCDNEDPESCLNITYGVITSRRYRRFMIVVFALMVALYFLWAKFLRHAWEEEHAFKEGFTDCNSGTYGIHRGGNYESIKIQDLSQNLVPGDNEHDPDGKRRLVFVGDVHGCKGRLLALLDKVGFNTKTDHLILTGDVISKGPDSPAVIDVLVRLNATSVRGNHEDRILLAADSHPHLLSPISSSAANGEALLSKGFAKDAALLRKLTNAQLEFLKRTPLVVRIPARTNVKPRHSNPNLEEILVVHAGLVPAVPILRQDPFYIMNMRNMNRHTHMPYTSRDRGVPWYELWNWYGERVASSKSLRNFHDFTEGARTAEPRLPMTMALGTLWDTVMEQVRNLTGSWHHKNRPRPQVVVYGHNSKDGVHIHRWTKGLDSGCVSGGDLTALVLNAAGEEEIVNVGCEDQCTS